MYLFFEQYVLLGISHISYLTDPSNESMDFFRNKLRQELIPLLETYNPRFKQLAARSARILAEDYQFILTEGSGILALHRRGEGGVRQVPTAGMVGCTCGNSEVFDQGSSPLSDRVRSEYRMETRCGSR